MKCKKFQNVISVVCIASLVFFLCAFYTFRGETGTGDANVVSYQTPIDTSRGGTKWTRLFASTTSYVTSYNSTPILTEDAIYIVNADTLYELDYDSGEILRQMTLVARMNTVCNMLYSDQYLYIPLNGGRMECVDVSTMTLCWQSEAFGGQSLSTVFYYEDYVYAGSTVVDSNGTTGTFYCLDATDGSTVWTYTDEDNLGGYYWSGGIVYDGALYFSGDNGILVSHSTDSDEVYDTYTLTDSAYVRAGITYDAAKDALYTVSNDGTLYEIKANNGYIISVSSATLISGSTQVNCTSTPTIYNGRIYIGCMADQYGYIVVMDADTLSTIYTVKGTQYAEIKSSPLVSTRGDLSGTVYVYVSANAVPGGVYYIVDKPDTTSAELMTLYTPATAKQFCLSSITSGTDGTLYYSNDSGTLFAVNEVDVSSDAISSDDAADTSSSDDTVASPSPSPTATTNYISPKKPSNIKIKRKKNKAKIRWNKKNKQSQTVLKIKVGKKKWKKKVIKKKRYAIIKARKCKTLRIRLASRVKYNGTWHYSSYTKTYKSKGRS